ncbi:hypothetical protein AZE42_07962 [Rhizopogon vesiculosus]|uniref:Uncharacterized protein n=1 Tax=Rhizopogon vesiculosus TaxID=180088 RepID=A0A1J8PZ89_9AGAM|nr:hypothetical protein AZE42_07962 [Rhizopogon vesiculosus]
MYSINWPTSSSLSNVTPFNHLMKGTTSLLAKMFESLGRPDMVLCVCGGLRVYHRLSFILTVIVRTRVSHTRRDFISCFGMKVGLLAKEVVI